AFRPIENRIRDVLETYANTHSKESSNAKITTAYYEGARKNLAKSLGVSEDFAILPCGTGATGAIKKLQEILGLYIPPASKKRYKIKINKKKLPLVIIGAYEHHSNEISLREALCEVKRIKLNKDGLLDLEDLKKILKKNKKREIIASISLASNVTGIISPYKKISKILRSYKAIVCFDTAASSPYMNVPCKYYDAIFASPHKLLGGVGSCGLLVIKKSLVDTSLAPSFAGGGTVTYVNKKRHNYIKDLEYREDAGTPAILQFIKASLAYCLRNEIGFDFIEKRKEELKKLFISELKKIPNAIIYGNQEVKALGIISFNIKGIDPYVLCEKLSEQGNFQTRAGCSCAGSYGHDLIHIENPNEEDKPAWLRVSIHFSHTEDEVLALIEGIKKIIS
nr:aminotransferase class V-fold PLP-dependent enzyme [Arcobacter sp.]